MAGISKNTFPGPQFGRQDYGAGIYYPSTIEGLSNSSAVSCPQDFISFSPFFCTFPHTFTGVAFQNATSVNGNKFRMGIYTSVNRQPSALIVDSGELTVADTNTNTLRNIAISQALNGNAPYWVAFITNASSSAYGVGGVAHFNAAAEIGSSTGTVSTNAAFVGFRMSQVYGALPATASGLVSWNSAAINGPLVSLKG